MAITSPYQTFQDLTEAVIHDCKENTASSAVVDLVKRYINEGYEIVNARKKREFLDRTFPVSLEAKQILTVSTTNGASSIVNIGTAVLPVTTIERGITITGTNEIYQVDSISSNTIYITTSFKGATSTSTGAVLFQRSVLLDENIKEVNQVYHNYYSVPLRNVGPERWNIDALDCPFTYSYAEEFALFGRSISDNDVRRMLIYPYPDTAYTLYVDATVQWAELTMATDEPLIPIKFRQILYFYGMAKLWAFHRMFDKADSAMQMFLAWQATLDGLNEESQDYPQLIVDYPRPFRRRSYKTFDSRYREDPD